MFEWVLIHYFSCDATLVLKPKAFLQSYLPTSVSPNGLQFKTAFCNYNICYICKFLNSYFSLLLLKFLPLIKIKCCLLNCTDFNLRPLYLCFRYLCICMSSIFLPIFGVELRCSLNFVTGCQEQPLNSGFLSLFLIISENNFIKCSSRMCFSWCDTLAKFGWN